MSVLVRCHSSADGELEIVHGSPNVTMSAGVHGYHGWRERMNGPLRRRVPASTAVTIVMSSTAERICLTRASLGAQALDSRASLPAPPTPR
jgi:hypothetical protein